MVLTFWELNTETEHLSMYLWWIAQKVYSSRRNVKVPFYFFKSSTQSGFFFGIQREEQAERSFKLYDFMPWTPCFALCNLGGWNTFSYIFPSVLYFVPTGLHCTVPPLVMTVLCVSSWWGMEPPSWPWQKATVPSPPKSAIPMLSALRSVKVT